MQGNGLKQRRMVIYGVEMRRKNEANPAGSRSLRDFWRNEIPPRKLVRRKALNPQSPNLLAALLFASGSRVHVATIEKIGADEFVEVAV